MKPERRSRGVETAGPIIALFMAVIVLAAPARDARSSADLADAIADRLYLGLDENDVGLARDTVQKALETMRSDRSLAWSSAASGVMGKVTPLATFKTSTGYFCRRYREAVIGGVNGAVSSIRVACRDDDGVWRPVDW